MRVTSNGCEFEKHIYFVYFFISYCDSIGKRGEYKHSILIVRNSHVAKFVFDNQALKCRTREHMRQQQDFYNLASNCMKQSMNLTASFGDTSDQNRNKQQQQQQQQPQEQQQQQMNPHSNNHRPYYDNYYESEKQSDNRYNRHRHGHRNHNSNYGR